MKKTFTTIFLIFLTFTSQAIPDQWYVYEHEMTTENLNFMGVEGNYAVGDNGVVLYCEYPIFLTTDPEWGDCSAPTSENLYGVFYRVFNDIVVGANGTIIYNEYTPYDPFWIFVDSPTTNDLYSITLPDLHWGFIVGVGGTILFGGGDPPDEWDLYEPSPTTQDLFSVASGYPDPNTAWAVGAEGTILDYEDSVWSLYPSSPTTNDLYGVFVYNQNFAFACGANGTILLWDGSTWNLIDTPTPENLYSIWGDLDYYFYCVGNNGTILKSYDYGYTWYLQDCPVDVDLHGVAGYYPIWAVGDGGTILAEDWMPDIQPTSLGQVRALFAPPGAGEGMGVEGSKSKIEKIRARF